MGWSKDPGPPQAGKFPAILFVLWVIAINELSVFIDESGDFGPYDATAPYYLVTLILHEQSVDITKNISQLDTAVKNVGFENHAIHTGPLIRRESVYRNYKIDERKQVFNCIFNFARKVSIKYKNVYIDKKYLNSQLELNMKLSKEISNFLKDNLDYFIRFDKVVLYYDNGQVELTKILVSVFNSLLNNIEIRNVKPVDYKLFQVADLICTLKLLNLKRCDANLSNSEKQFFGSQRELYKNYIKPILKKSFD